MRDRGTGASYGADEVVKDFKCLHRALVVAGGDELTRRLDHERHHLLKVVLGGGKRPCVVWPLSARDRQEGRVATGRTRRAGVSASSLSSLRALCTRDVDAHACLVGEAGAGPGRSGWRRDTVLEGVDAHDVALAVLEHGREELEVVVKVVAEDGARVLGDRAEEEHADLALVGDRAGAALVDELQEVRPRLVLLVLGDRGDDRGDRVLDQGSARRRRSPRLRERCWRGQGGDGATYLGSDTASWSSVALMWALTFGTSRRQAVWRRWRRSTAASWRTDQFCARPRISVRTTMMAFLVK